MKNSTFSHVKNIFPLFLLFFYLGNKNVLANPGDSCSSAISFTNSIKDSIAPVHFRWYSFIANYDSTVISVNDSSIGKGYIQSISVFSACGGSPIGQIRTSDSTKDSIILNVTGLVTG